MFRGPLQEPRRSSPLASGLGWQRLFAGFPRRHRTLHTDHILQVESGESVAKLGVDTVRRVRQNHATVEACRDGRTDRIQRTGALAGCSPGPDGPPSAQCSCAPRAAAIPCSSSSKVRAGLRAPRRWPGPRYMPRSVSLVGLARRGVIPQNNSTSKCSFCDPVVLGGLPILVISWTRH